MKKFFFLSIFAIILSTTFFGASEVEAKSVIWTSGTLSGSNYVQKNSSNSRKIGVKTVDISSYNVLITYVASMVNADTDESLGDGDSVPVGTKIRITPKPYEDVDISFFATGGSADSPYGLWGLKHMKDVFKDYINQGAKTKISHIGIGNKYIQDLGVAWKGRKGIFLWADEPDSISFDHTGSTATFVCDDVKGDVCTITGAGQFVSTVVFGDTNYCVEPFDYRNELPEVSAQSLQETMNISDSKLMKLLGISDKELQMILALDSSGVKKKLSPAQQKILLDELNRRELQAQLKGGEKSCAGGALFSNLNPTVPKQSIVFTISSVDKNQAPTAPSIDLPSSCQTNEEYSLSVTGSDPDQDPIRYEFDWNNDGAVDQRMPASGYVPSGTQQKVVHTWSIPASYSFKVRVTDNQGKSSVWASSDTFGCIAPPPPPSIPTVDLTINDFATIALKQGDPMTIKWDSTNAISCIANSGAGFASSGNHLYQSDGVTEAVDGSLTNVPARFSGDYKITCQASNGVESSDIVSVVVSCDEYCDPWSVCSKSCGVGKQSRRCTASNCNPYNEYKDCNTNACSGSSWQEVAP